MNIFPLKTWRARRREMSRVRPLIAQVMKLQSRLEGFAFVSKEARDEAKTSRKQLRGLLRDLRSVLASNEGGKLADVSQASFLKSTRVANELMEREAELLGSISSASELIESLLKSVGAIPLDQARAVQMQLIAVRDDFRRIARTNPMRQTILERIKFVERSSVSVGELQSLIQESAIVAVKADEISQLPLRTTYENRRKREMLTKYVSEVQRARESGDAYVLRESWRQFKHLTVVLERESEATVTRAVREIEMWLSHPELTPALTERFGDKWRVLLNRANSPSFLEEWSAMKKSVEKITNAGFEDHWQEITEKFQKGKKSKKLSWKELEATARQVRRRRMPAIYMN